MISINILWLVIYNVVNLFAVTTVIKNFFFLSVVDSDEKYFQRQILNDIPCHFEILHQPLALNRVWLGGLLNKWCAPSTSIPFEFKFEAIGLTNVQNNYNYRRDDNSESTVNFCWSNVCEVGNEITQKRCPFSRKFTRRENYFEVWINQSL